MSARTLLTGAELSETGNAEYVLAPDTALLVTEQGNAFAFDMRDSFYAISPVGAAMLEQTLRKGKAAAVAAVCAEFDADAETVEADLQSFLDDLEARKFLRRSTSVAEAERAGWLTGLFARTAKRSLMHLPSAKARAVAILTMARLSFALCGWTKTIAAWRRHVATGAGNGNAPTERLEEIDEFIRTMSAKLPFGGNCKERALGCWAMARFIGEPAALIVGVAQFPLAGHTWCETPTGRILGDDAEHCAAYFPVFRYG